MILDTTSKSIQVVLGAAPASAQAAIFASYADLTSTSFTGGSNDLASNGTTAVTAVAAPSASTQRQVKHLSIYNADSVNMQITVQLLDGANTRVLQKTTLIPGQTLEWTPDNGWKSPYILTSTTPDFISGIRLAWISGSSISISSGECWVPGNYSLWRSPSTITKSSVSIGASSWAHLYAYLNAGIPDVEISTTAPSSPYAGNARTKSGDASRRYIGSIRSGPSGNIMQFQHDIYSNKISYLGSDYSLRNLLSNGMATSTTTVSASSIAPVTASHIDILISNAATTGPVITSNSEAALPLGAGAGNSYYAYCGARTGVAISEHPVDSSIAFTYRFISAPDGGAYIDFNAYTYGR